MWPHGLGPCMKDACHLGPKTQLCLGSGMSEQPPACDPEPVVRLKQLDV